MVLAAFGEEVLDGFGVAGTAVGTIGSVGFVDAVKVIVEWSVAGSDVPVSDQLRWMTGNYGHQLPVVMTGS